MKKGYVYALQGTPEAFRAYLEALGQPLFHWAADEGSMRIAQGMPSEWKDQGAAFGPKGELRWWREDETFRALLLMSEPVGNLTPVPGEWHTAVHEFDLQNLHEPRVRPNFDEYPHGDHQGRLVAQTFYRDGSPIFISPRVLKGKER